jgi:hypothetical protein
VGSNKRKIFLEKEGALNANGFSKSSVTDFFEPDSFYM